MTTSPAPLFHFGDVVTFQDPDATHKRTVTGVVRTVEPGRVQVQAGNQWYYFGDSGAHCTNSIDALSHA